MSTATLAPQESAPLITEEAPEAYARSMRALMRWGARQLLEASGIEMPESSEAEYATEASTREMARADFYAAVIENFHASDEVEGLNAERRSTYEVRDGAIRTVDGSSIGELIERGIDASKRAAKLDPAMEAQVSRDEIDLHIYDEALQLQPGEAMLLLSMEPKEALAQYPSVYKDLGYRDGQARLQLYACTSDGQIVAGAIAVTNSDTTAWRGLLAAKFGVKVPANATCNEWGQYIAHLQLDPEAAWQQALDTRSEYYALIGRGHQRLSVPEFVAAHGALVDTYIDRYLAPLARAIYTRQNEPVLRDFARAVEATPMFYRLRRVQQAVHQVAAWKTGDIFTAEMGRAMEELTRFALLEDMWQDLDAVLRQGMTFTVPSYDAFAQLSDSLLALRAAESVNRGVEAGHSYGGCAGANPADDRQNNNSLNPQDVFGGKGTSSSESGGDCDYIHAGCYCSPYNADGTQSPAPVRVKAHKNAAGSFCERPGCGAFILNNGAKYRGGIAAKAEVLQREASKHKAAA